MEVNIFVIPTGAEESPDISKLASIGPEIVRDVSTSLDMTKA
jgi:hypothetical protein